MGLAQAVKRRYRYFIPPSLLAPRPLVRRSIEPLLIYICGVTTGLYFYARPGEGERITTVSTLAMFVLLALKWWSDTGVKRPEDKGGHQ